jgi:hypothetical protein
MKVTVRFGQNFTKIINRRKNNSPLLVPSKPNGFTL